MKIVIDGREVTLPSGSGGGVPKGSIIIWSGTASDIPDGWALCDGQDGRPDLRDRFVLGGGGTHTAGETGGEEKHTLTVEEMPDHGHGILILSSESGYYSTAGPIEGSLSGKTQATEPAGGSQPHNNMPPYYVLCYIIKVTDGGYGGGASVIQAYDTEDGWHVRKWSDGYMEQTLNKELTNIVVNAAVGSLYNTGKDYGPYQYPEPFSELYGVSALGAGKHTSILSAHYAVDKALHLTKTPSFGIYRPRPVSEGMDFYIFITARGRWK